MSGECPMASAWQRHDKGLLGVNIEDAKVGGRACSAVCGCYVACGGGLEQGPRPKPMCPLRGQVRLFGGVGPWSVYIDAR